MNRRDFFASLLAPVLARFAPKRVFVFKASALGPTSLLGSSITVTNPRTGFRLTLPPGEEF